MKTSITLYCAECRRELNIADAEQTISDRRIIRPGQKDTREQDFELWVDVCMCAGGKGKQSRDQRRSSPVASAPSCCVPSPGEAE